MMKTGTKILFILSILMVSLLAFGQIATTQRELNERSNIHNRLNWTKDQANRKFDIQNSEIEKVFAEIQEAIKSKDIGTISKHLKTQTYLNLPNGISGYYSANQAYFVLEDFLKKYRVVSFKFDEINVSTLNPFATGVYNYELKGRRNSVHIYIQIRESSNNWTITQITTN
jgi:hypothetical protein